MPPTRHTHSPAFGRLVLGCPRCAELAGGAAPRPGYQSHRRRLEASQAAAIRAHFAPNGPHARGACGPVCTFGDP